NVLVRPSGAGLPEVIVIESADPQVIYVPRYDPATVIYAPAPGTPYPYYWSAPYPYYYDPAAPFFMGLFVGTSIGYGRDWDDHEIHQGDINIDNTVNIDRNTLKERLENRQNSRLSDRIRNNPENVWRPSDTAARLDRQALADRAPGRSIGDGSNR